MVPSVPNILFIKINNKPEFINPALVAKVISSSGLDTNLPPYIPTGAKPVSKANSFKNHKAAQFSFLPQTVIANFPPGFKTLNASLIAFC